MHDIVTSVDKVKPLPLHLRALGLAALLLTPACTVDTAWTPVSRDARIVGDARGDVKPRDDGRASVAAGPRITVVDTGGFRIASAAVISKYGYPSVAWGTDGYFVVWPKNGAIVGRVVKSATIFSSADLPVSRNTVSAKGRPSIAFRGEVYVVTWAMPREPGPALGIFGMDISRAGAQAHTQDQSLSMSSPLAAVYSAPAVAAGSAGLLLTYEDGRNILSPERPEIYARRRPKHVFGDVRGLQVSAIANPQRAPAVAASAGQYLVAWTVVRSGTSDIHAARMVPTAAQPLDRPPISLATSGPQINASVASSGIDFVVAWRAPDNKAIHLDRVTAAGKALDSPGGVVIATTATGAPTIASNGKDYLVAWIEPRGIFARRVTTDTGRIVAGPRVMVAPLPVGAASPGDVPAVSIASDGTQYLIVWRTDAPVEIRGARVAP